MTKMKTLLMLAVLNLILCLFVNIVRAQDREVPVMANIDSVEIRNIFNYSHTDMRVSDLNGKAILLDFGGLGCRGCLLSLPVFDSLQRKFKDDLIVFWVTGNSEEDIRHFLSDTKLGKGLSMPVIAADTLLHKLFPVHSEPTVVWIDVHGNVLAKTGAMFIKSQAVDYLVKYRMGVTRIY